MMLTPGLLPMIADNCRMRFLPAATPNDGRPRRLPTTAVNGRSFLCMQFKTTSPLKKT